MTVIDMMYGSFNFEPQPIPFMTIDKEYVKGDNSLNVSTNIQVTLDGIVVKGTGGVDAGIVAVDTQIDIIREAFNQDGLLFLVVCSGSAISQSFSIETSDFLELETEDFFTIETEGSSGLGFTDVSDIVFSGYPRIRSLEFFPSNDNWTVSAPFRIILDFDVTDPLEDTALLPPFLQSVTENWSIEPLDQDYTFNWTLNDGRVDSCPYKLRVTHDVGAVGKSAYSGNGLIQPAWQWARAYVTGLLGFDENKVSHEGVVTFDFTKFGPFNHNRNTITNIKEGAFSVNENWLVVETGVGASGLPANAIENFTIDVQQNNTDDITTASIAGEIRGLADISLTGGPLTVTSTAYAGASGYWREIQGRLLPRVELVGSDTALRSFHPLPANQNINHVPCDGTISYTYEYNDRPATCTAEALREEIEITDDNPVDVFASLTILGRAIGPILQDLATVTAPRRTVSIDLQMEPATGCPTNGEFANWFAQKPTGVDELIDSLEADLTGNYSKVFKENDVDDWRATEGSYTRTVTWTYTDCS